MREHSHFRFFPCLCSSIDQQWQQNWRLWCQRVRWGNLEMLATYYPYAEPLVTIAVFSDEWKYIFIHFLSLSFIDQPIEIIKLVLAVPKNLVWVSLKSSYSRLSSLTLSNDRRQLRWVFTFNLLSSLVNWSAISYNEIEVGGTKELCAGI